MQQMVAQFVSAVNYFKSKKEIDVKELEKKCLECITIIRISQKKKKQPEVEYELFRLISTEILLMCCPAVKNNIDIDSSHESYGLLERLCTIDESLIIPVIISLQSCRYLKGVVCWLPLEANCTLLKVHLGLECLSPISFITVRDLIYGVLFSSQFEGYSQSMEEAMRDTELFLIRAFLFMNVGKDLKIYAFLIHCITSSLTFMLNFLSGKKIPVYTTMSLLSSGRPEKSYSSMCEDQKNVVSSLVKAIFISAETFINIVTYQEFNQFEGLKTQLFDFPQEFMVEELILSDPADNVMKHIAYDAYVILQFLNSKDFCMPQLNDKVYFKLFLAQVAKAPVSFSEKSASLEYLISDVNTTNCDESMEKIMQNKEIFTSPSFSLSILTRNIKYYNSDATKTLISNAIQFGLQEKNYFNFEWKSVLLNYAMQLPNKVLVQIIKEDLSNGSVEVLKTKNFGEDLITIFNQLDSTKNISTEFLHLGLQCGTEVVSKSVKHAFEMPGLEHVLVLTLENLSCVCFSKSKKGTSIVVEALMKCIPEVNNAEKKNCFVKLCIKFLEMYKKTDAKKREEGDSFPKELLHEIVLQGLNCSANKIPFDCEACLDIFDVMIYMFPEVVFRPSPEFAASVITMTLMYNNFCCEDFSHCSDTRDLIRSILDAMIVQIKQNRLKFNKEISTVNLNLRKFNLHPRCYILVCGGGLAIEFNPPTFCDKVLRELCKEGNLSPDIMGKLTEDIYQWTWALLQILPEAEEAEWVKAMQATNCSTFITQPSPPNIVQTLHVFSVILLAECASYTERSLSEEEIFVKQKSLFTVFSSAAITYITENIEDLIVAKKAETVCNLGSWWCMSTSKFECHPEPLSLFVSKLSDFLLDILYICEIESDINLSPKNGHNDSNLVFKSLGSNVVTAVENFIKAVESLPDSGAKSTIDMKLRKCLEL